MKQETTEPNYERLLLAVRRFGRFRKRWAVLEGLARAVLIGPGALLAWFLADWLAGLPAWPLLASFLLALAVGAWALAWRLVRPMLRRIRIEREALIAESLHGALDNQLIGALQLGREIAESAEPLGYSPNLVHSLVARTAVLVAGAQPHSGDSWVPRPVEGRGMPRPYLGVREEASRDRKYVLHLSGTLGSEVLAAAREAGAFPLAFHPVQTFAAPGPRLFEGITCAVEGDREAVAFGRELAEFLGARPVEVRREDKALYHAGLAVACNYLVALAEAGRALLERAGLGPTALDALLPLLRGTVENLARVGLPGALTGPISRADLATLRAHLDALRERAPEFLPLYRILGSRTVDLALRKGTIDERQAAEMRRLLEAP